MNNKQYIHYFTKSNTPKTIALIVAVLGFVLVLFSPNYYLFVVGGAMVPVGIVGFFFFAAGIAGDSDMEDRIVDGLGHFEPRPEEDRYYAKRMDKSSEKSVIEGYEYEDGMMFKIAENGTVRSSEYTRSIIYPLTDALYIARRTVSLVSDEVRDRVEEIPYRAITSVELVQERKTMRFGKKDFLVKKTTLVIFYGEDQIFRTPIQDDLNAEHFVEKIQRMVAKNQEIKE